MAIYSSGNSPLLYFFKDVHRINTSANIPISTSVGEHYLVTDMLDVSKGLLVGDYQLVPPKHFMKNPNNRWIIMLSGEMFDMTTPDTPTSKTINIIKTLVNFKKVLFITQHRMQHNPDIKTVGTFDQWEVFSMLHSWSWPVKDVQHYKKRFAYINRRNSKHRSKLFYNIWNIPNFPENSYASFNPGNYWNTWNLSDQDAQQEIQLEWNRILNNITDSHIVDWLKNTKLPQLPEQYSRPDQLKYDWFAAGLGTLMCDTAINLIAETAVGYVPYKLFATEKLYRSIVVGQPFIVHSHPHYLKYLKTMGYKTFGDVWDESYDETVDGDQRIEKITQVVTGLINLSDSEFNTILEKTRLICQHNLENIAKRCSYESVVSQISEPFKKQLNRDPFKLKTVLPGRRHYC